MNHMRRKSALRVAFLTTASLLAGTAVAQNSLTGVRNSLSLMGNTGLIDMPSAEVQPDFETSWSFSGFSNTRRATLNFQAIPNLETTFRYTQVEEWNPNGSQTFRPGFDLKWQFLEEDRQGWRPAMSVGLRDFIGESVYGSEFVVATKHVTDSLKVTGGLGWGRLGSLNGFDNPIGLIFPNANDRPVNDGSSGSVRWDTLFRGDAAFFGGVEWRTPVAGLNVKAEYSSDAYTQEQLYSDFERKSPFNVGIEYQPGNRFALGAYYMYGSAVGLRLTLSGNPNDPVTLQDFGAGPPPINRRNPKAVNQTDWAQNPKSQERLMKALSEAARSQQIAIVKGDIGAREAEIQIANGRLRNHSEAIGRAARLMAIGMPPSVETFRITMVDNDVPITTAVIKRSDLEAQVDTPNAGIKSWETTVLEDGKTLKGDDIWDPRDYPRFRWSFNPRIPLQFGFGDEPVRYDVVLTGRARVNIAQGFSIAGQASQRVFGTLDNPPDARPEDNLYPVRSNSFLYRAQAGPSLDRLTGDYVFKLAPAIYGSVTGGYLERGYGGIAGEVLWKPVSQNWGIGAEIAYARERDYYSKLGFNDYDTITGFASFYWDPDFYGIQTRVDVGRYLAEDWGATISVSRRFINGWEVGAFFTKTEASKEEFGRDGFDKGIRVRIPLGWTLPFESRSTIGATLNSQDRDAGARLRTPNNLYGIVREYEAGDLKQGWGGFWQ
ncbi:YjbH domain-containing protein [Oceanomicrobium pacificus]|uniref:YjbH domain-containing protein n=1 Tax=Oceanomicrobium pacificus TaxID=2692916 RepID=A0A6B0TJL0_9RHOB|nr:YjbH domain-containing protein [Oceanomicrobium pacificus]MXU64670.1 YjbH domain-containing protein [Oceanomicrobium pacificus]